MATHDGFMAFPAFLLAVLLPVLGAATATAEGGRPPRAAVFRAPGFPSADAPAIEDATLATALAGLPVETIDSPSGLASRLKRTDHDVLLLPYGSAFPLEAWPAIREFVKQGGGLVVLGGAPCSKDTNDCPRIKAVPQARDRGPSRPPSRRPPGSTPRTLLKTRL